MNPTQSATWILPALLLLLLVGWQSPLLVNAQRPQFPPGTVSPNLFHFGDPLALRVYISENKQWVPTDALVWEQEGILYGSWEQYSQSITFNATTAMKNKRGPLYAHVHLFKEGADNNPKAKNYRSVSVIHQVILLNKYMPKKVVAATKNLLTGEHHTMPNSGNTEKEIGSCWCPNVTISLVVESEPIVHGTTPPQVAQFMRYHPSGGYFPFLYRNDFWVLKEEYFPINETTTELELNLLFQPISTFQWQMMVQLDQSFKLHVEYGLSDDNHDDIKRMLRDTNPYLLALTFAVTLLHSVLDFLAFKNDISFWRNKRSMEGLSVRTIFVNVFFQTVIFLYLLDNETSTIILVSNGIGLVIEFWKISKAMVVQLNFSGGFPFISLQERNTYTRKTKEYDQQAFRYVSWVAYPLVVCYTIYSLVYESHKSWYSFILNTLVGFVYMFGFIMMTPQLFINYKLKSVAHMPWKTLMYKSLNTFIDDLFAFVITMPLLHRLACLRDDVIFFVYLYQRWKYPVDHTRANEFGQVGEGHEEDEEAEEEDQGDKKEEQDEKKENHVGKKDQIDNKDEQMEAASTSNTSKKNRKNRKNRKNKKNSEKQGSKEAHAHQD